MHFGLGGPCLICVMIMPGNCSMLIITNYRQNTGGISSHTSIWVSEYTCIRAPGTGQKVEGKH